MIKKSESKIYAGSNYKTYGILLIIFYFSELSLFQIPTRVTFVYFFSKTIINTILCFIYLL